jgi:hypothetical protein
MNPEIYALSLIEWQLFLSLTFRSENLADAVRIKMFFALMREQADNFGVHFKQTIWCLRTEAGEITGRLHLHALIAGLPPHALTTATCFSFMRIWERLNGGMARVSLSTAHCLTVWAMSSKVAKRNTHGPAGIIMRPESLEETATSCFPSRSSK